MSRTVPETTPDRKVFMEVQALRRLRTEAQTGDIRTQKKGKGVFIYLISKAMINSDEKRVLLNILMTSQNCKCYYCGCYCFIGTIQQRIDKDKYNDIATIEHLLPVGMPDRNKRVNLVMACNKCNHERSIAKNSRHKTIKGKAKYL